MIIKLFLQICLQLFGILRRVALVKQFCSFTYGRGLVHFFLYVSITFVRTGPILAKIKNVKNGIYRF